jgi:transcriptional regulator with XRE-family HTH domain
VSLGRRLKKRRLESGLTQAELAAPNYTHAYVSSIEAGRRRPSPAALSHFAEKLGIDGDELATGRPPDLGAQLDLRLQEARKLISAGAFSAATEEFEQIAREAKRYDLIRTQAKAVQGIALCTERAGAIEKAVERYEEAEDILRAESPIARADIVAGRARCLQMLGETRYAAYLLELLLESLERNEL